MSGLGSTYGVGWGQHIGWEGVSGGTVEPLLYDHPQNHIGVVV